MRSVVRIYPGPPLLLWGCSSAGRAPALQAGGHRFDPGQLHQTLKRSTAAVTEGSSDPTSNCQGTSPRFPCHGLHFRSNKRMSGKVTALSLSSRPERSAVEGSAVVPVSTALELFKVEHPKWMLTFEQRLKATVRTHPRVGTGLISGATGYLTTKSIG